MSAPRSWRWFKLLSILLGLLMLETGLRLVDPPMAWSAGAFDGHRLDIRAWKWWDNQRGGEFNPQGYRDTDWAALSSAKRAVFVGDSRVYGLYLDPEQTISARFTAQAPGWVGLNMGEVGMTPVELVDGLQEEITALSPQLVVLSVDINPSVLALASRRDFSRRSDALAHLLRSVAILRHLELGVRAAWAQGARQRVQSIDEYTADMQETLAHLSASGSVRPVVLVGWTPMPAIDGLWDPVTYDAYRAASRLAAVESGADVIEVEAVLSGMRASDAFVGSGLHYSAQASDKIAAAVWALVSP